MSVFKGQTAVAALTRTLPPELTVEQGSVPAGERSPSYTIRSGKEEGVGAETAHGCYRPILTDDPGDGHLLPASLEVGTSGYLDPFTSLWTLINAYSLSYRL